MKHVNNTRERDKHVIEAVARQFGPVSRSQIHELTNIRRTTTSNLVRELLEEGKLLEAGYLDNQLGRKQALLRLNPGYRHVAVIEFDDETVVAGIMDLEGRLKCTLTEPSNLCGGIDGLVRQLLCAIRGCLDRADLPPSALLGIGVADSGYVDSRRGLTLTSSTIDFWHQVPVQSIFEKEFGVPAILEARTRAKAVAERTLGAGQSVDNLIYMDYGSGIGAAVIIDGRLIYGQDCGAGEFGHTHVIRDGPMCKCGSYGCLEAIAGTRAVEARLRQAMADGARSEALALAGGDPARITGWTVLRAASQGDKISLNILAEIATYIGLGLANLVNLFNPAVVVLDPDLELAGPQLLDQIAQVVKRQALSDATGRLVFSPGKLGREAAILGVGLMVLEQHFEIPALKPPSFLVEER